MMNYKDKIIGKHKFTKKDWEEHEKQVLEEDLEVFRKEEKRMTIEFFAPGIPQTAGSKKGIYIPKIKRTIVVDSNPKGFTTWRATVQSFAIKAKQTVNIPGNELLYCPIILTVTFLFSHPKGDFGTGVNAGVLKNSAPDLHIKRPDATKLLRCLEDALNGVVWKDDSQIVKQIVKKEYTFESPGARVTIQALN